jgi:hypothetical protein
MRKIRGGSRRKEANVMPVVYEKHGNVNLVSYTHNFSRALPEVTLTFARMGELEPRTVN